MVVMKKASANHLIRRLDTRQVNRKCMESLVITDWKMEPVSGIEFVRQLRNEETSPNPFIPFNKAASKNTRGKSISFPSGLKVFCIMTKSPPIAKG